MIPKLRQQVQRLLKKCVPCQKLNNLPFPYPKMGPLSEERVVHSKPFENVRLDYFGPLAVKDNEHGNKCTD